MPTPILRIPIDDEAFKSFLKTFEKYQAQIKEQPGFWEDVNDSVITTVASAAALASEIERQAAAARAVGEQEEESEKRQDKTRRRRAQEKKDSDRHEEASHQRRKRAIQQVKEGAQAVQGAIKSFASWGILDSVLGLGTAALAGFGIANLAQGVGDERRLSAGLNVRPGQRQGLAANVGRYFDVNSVLSNIANAQGDPSQWAVFSTMGVDKNQDPAKLTAEMAMRARQMFIADKGNLALAQAQGLTNIFSPDDLRRMANTPEAEMRHQFKRSQKVQGLSDEVGRKWQDFTSQIEMTGLALKNKFADKLIVFEPSLSMIINKLGDLALNVLDRIDWKVLGDGLDTFTKYVTSDEFLNDFKTFGDNMSYLVKQLGGWMKFFGLLPDGTPNAVERPDPQLVGGNDPLSRGLNYGINRGVDFFSGRYFQGKTKASQEDINYVAKKMMSGGWNKEQTAGIMANIGAESDYNPHARGDWNPRTRRYEAYGIAQWHADRRAGYTKIFGHSMESVKDRKQALKEQLEFMNWELHKTEKKAGAKLRGSRTAYEAGSNLSQYYERPADRYGQASARGNRAANVRITVKNQTGASVATSVNSAAGR